MKTTVYLAFHLFILLFPACLIAQQANDAMLQKTWYESPHESDLTDHVIAYRLNKYLPVPGIDVNPDFKYNVLTFKQNGVLEVTEWRWCDAAEKESGTWTLQPNTNDVIIQFGACRYALSLLDLKADFLLIKFKEQ